MKLRVLGSALAAAAIMMLAPAAQAAPPVEAFVGYDTFRSAALSPNGRYVAGVRREQVGDVLVVIDWQTRTTKAIEYARRDQFMEISAIEWKGDSRILFTLTQRVVVEPGRVGVNRNQQLDDGFFYVSRIWSTGIDGSNRVNLYTPNAGSDLPRWVSPNVSSVLPDDPDHILLAAPSVGGTQLRMININTGEAKTVETGSLTTGDWVLDANRTPVLRSDGIAGGRGFAWQRRAPGTRNWIEVARFRGATGANSGVDFQGIGPAPGVGRVYVLARPPGKDTTGVYVYDTATGQYVQEVVSRDDFDVTAVPIVKAKSKELVATCFNTRRYDCVAHDNTFGAHYRGLQRAFPDNNIRVVDVADLGNNEQRWLVFMDGPRDFGTYMMYSTATRQPDFLGEARPNIPTETLPSMEIVEYTANDGQKLWGYLTVPFGAENAKNLPLVMLPHGGPEGRDVYGLDFMASYWAAHGYLVFQPQFRGGGGMGRRWVQAGWRQWGQRMQRDVRDGAEALIASGRADRNRVCIAGWSYGGYATMTGALVDGDLYKCAMAGAGVSDLLAMLQWVRVGQPNDVIDGGGQGAQSVSYKYWSTAIGDANDDREMLIRYSATRNADKINIPMLIVHGDEDETVPVEQSIILYEALKRAGKPVQYIELKDMNHYYQPDQGDQWRTVLTEGLRFFQQNIGPGWTAARTN